jgi:hypothetical protein
MAQDRDQWRALVNTAMNIKCWEVLQWLQIDGSSRRAQLRE